MITVDGLDKDTIEEIYTFEYADVRQFVARDEGNSSIEFTSDIVLEDERTLQGATFTYSTTKGDVLTVDTVSAADSSRTPGTYVIGPSDYTTDLPLELVHFLHCSRIGWCGYSNYYKWW